MIDPVLDQVVVGVDSPEPRQAAIELAALQARRFDTGLTLMHVLQPPVQFSMSPLAVGLEDIAKADQSMLDKLIATVTLEHPDIRVQGDLVIGTPAYDLIQASHRAKLLVLGCRGIGGFEEMLLGSVSAQVAVHASCPTIVVRPLRPDDLPGGPIVVGVDGSASSRAAVEFAVLQAVGTDCEIEAVHVWHPDYSGANDGQELLGIVDQETAAEALLAECVAGYADKYPDVRIGQIVVRHEAAEEVMVRASERASLVVVGSRGRGAFRGLILGSVSQALLHHGRCPIAVVRPPM